MMANPLCMRFNFEFFSNKFFNQSYYLSHFGVTKNIVPVSSL